MSAGDAAAVAQPDFDHHYLMYAQQHKWLSAIVLDLSIAAMLNSRDHLQLVAQAC